MAQIHAELRIDAQKVKLSKEIGDGAFSKVFKARIEGEEEDFAVKVVKEHTTVRNAIDKVWYWTRAKCFGKKEHAISSMPRSKIFEEIRMLSVGRDCPFIVNLVGFSEVGGYGGGKILIISEFLSYKSELACGYVRENYDNPKLLLFVFMMMVPIARALIFLHDLRIVHRDVKLQNILLSQEGVPKLCDFGFASELDESESFVQLEKGHGEATAFFVAPEVLGECRVYPSSDAYSFAVTFIQALQEQSSLLHLFNNRPWEEVVTVMRNPVEYEGMLINFSTTMRNHFRDMFRIHDSTFRNQEPLWVAVVARLSNMTLCDPEMRPSLEKFLSIPQLKSMEEDWENFIQHQDTSEDFKSYQQMVADLENISKTTQPQEDEQ